MDTGEFEAKLRAEGYTEITTRTVDKQMDTPVHTHPFDAYAMVLEGEMSVICGSETTTCRTGDTFQLSAGREHTEHYGPQGARYIVGRRYRAEQAA